MNKPTVTIVTPSYNQGSFLEATIKSVIDQKYENLEYFVIDGGSVDNSLDVIRKYENQISFWVSEPDNGQSDAINKGFARATGKYINWLNSDDILLKGSLQKMVAYLEANNDVDIVYGNTMMIDKEGKDIVCRKEIQYDNNIILYSINYPT